ncbi:MAG TPA: hypothetical protein VEH04_09240 [Verrucomicrobiae bacterium]|nr:hypothetical protein [Verrucomicrobiae bacterium]
MHCRFSAQHSSIRSCCPAQQSFWRKAAQAVSLRFVFVLTAIVLLSGCATSKPVPGDRPFDFSRDTFAFTNQLVWDYYYDAGGNWVHERHKPDPDYTHHCFVVVRAARQFFQHARFEPAEPPVDVEEYRELIRRVVGRDPARPLHPSRRIVIPGYPDLRSFSAAHPELLKAECGGAWRSYFQRGHWRILFPFRRAQQKGVAEEFLKDLQSNQPPVAHLVKFPELTINHALLVFDARANGERIEFLAYDPNRNDQPASLFFDRATRTFHFEQTDYWPGGTLDVYEIYRSLFY